MKQTHSLIACVVLASVALSGCLGEGLTAVDGETPVAALDAESDAAFVTEPLRFDASASRDPNGAIVSLAIDFGDGTVKEVDHPDNASVEYAYATAGTYVVTLTVTDDGAGQANVLDDSTSLVVVIHDRVEFSGAVATANPVASNVSASTSRDLDVAAAAVSFEVAANVTGDQPLGDSKVRVAFVSPSGEVLAQQMVTVAADQTMGVSLDGPLVENGTYRVETEAIEGAATIDGVALIWYAPPTTEDGAREHESGG